ncbi:NB-ARC domain-containing protein [Kribbella sp. NPDC005582]|uniref:ATP-binding protein n=1 Tax=Kribbella sp. NPDC005582 TaxID=3156893 RepID=UPI0033B67E60
MTDFGPVLRRFRKAAGLSQERLVVESGVSVEAIKALEAGRRRYPWVQTVDLLSAGLGLGEDERAELKAAAARPKVGALPSDVADFVGRREEIAAVSELVSGSGQAPGVVVISALAGMGGVGKTALAVRVARELAGRLADGVLYVNLRGFGTGQAMTPLEGLNALLQQLGFALQRPPQSAEEAAGLFRTACASRSLLVVLDNAATVEQVLPLLPGTSSCAVIVTSRRALVGLPGAQPLALGVLQENEALKLLTAVAGRPRVDPDPQSALEVVALCGSLPLALRIAGTRLAAEPSWTVADLARELADETARLDVLADAEHGVRASIALSLKGASPEAAEVFRLIGLFEGDELDLKVAARLVDRPEAEVEPLLEHLVDLHLLESPSPRRYQFHDLVRTYAREIPTTADEQAAARDRVFSLYVAMAWQSRVRFGFSGVSREFFDERWVAGVEELEYDEVMLWLDAESADVLGAARRMMASPHPDRAAVVRLAMGMFMFWVVRHRQAEGAQLDELALAALRDEPTCAPPVASAVISYSAGAHYTAISDLETAASHLKVAIEVDTALEEESHLSFSMVALAHCLERLGRLDEAMELARAGLERGQRLADQMMEGEARLMLGVLAGRLGRFAEQDKSFELAVSLMRSRPGFVDLLSSAIGESYLRSGRTETARTWLRAHMDGVRAAGNKSAVAEHLRHLATAEVELDAYDAARAHLEEALELTGGGELEARIRHSLGTALSGLGETEPAREQWRIALELYRRYGLPQVDEVLQLLELVDDREDGQEAEGQEGEGQYGGADRGDADGLG